MTVSTTAAASAARHRGMTTPTCTAKPSNIHARMPAAAFRKHFHKAVPMPSVSFVGGVVVRRTVRSFSTSSSSPEAGNPPLYSRASPGRLSCSTLSQLSSKPLV
jgi:hypothetical protein